MSMVGFRFGGRNATLTRPDDKPAVTDGNTWARDRTSASSSDGTEIDATWANRMKAALEAVVTGLGGNLADGDQQLVNAVKAYVDAVAAGLSIKPAAMVATAANIVLSGTQTVDGVALVAGDVCLVRAQATASQNGLYVVAAGAWSRHPRMDAWSEVPGALVVVEQGADLHDTLWVCTSDPGGSLGSSAVAWSKFFDTALFQPVNTLLTAIAGLSMVSDRIIYGTGTNAVGLATLSAFARTLIDDADAATARATLAAEPQGEVYGENLQTGTTYTLVLADKGKRVRANNASAQTYTVPPNASVAFPVGSRIELFQYGAGQVTVAAGAGVTIRSSGGKLKIAGRYSAALLDKIATDEWLLIGDIAA